MQYTYLILLFLMPLALVAHEQHQHEEHHHEEHHDGLTFEDHAAHEHGRANANISYIDDTLVVALKIPAKDIFGFEHPPRNTLEKESVVSTLHFMEDSNNVLVADPHCTVNKITVSSDILTMEDHNHTHKDHHYHADVEANYQFACESNIELTFKLFDKFNSIEKIAVQYVSSTAQLLLNATPDNRTLSLDK